MRIVEYHTYEAGGKLVDPEHTDDGSLVTVDVLLSDRFEGGHLETPTPGGSAPTRPTCELCDALSFPTNMMLRRRGSASPGRRLLPTGCCLIGCDGRAAAAETVSGRSRARWGIRRRYAVPSPATTSARKWSSWRTSRPSSGAPPGLSLIHI